MSIRITLGDKVITTVYKIICCVACSAFATLTYANNLSHESDVSSTSYHAKQSKVLLSSSKLDRQQTWKVSKQDGDLRTVLTKWAQSVGWQLDWEVNANYPIEFDWVINDSFTGAINQVLIATQQTDVPLKAVMYNANKVLKIVRN